MVCHSGQRCGTGSSQGLQPNHWHMVDLAGPGIAQSLWLRPGTYHWLCKAYGISNTSRLVAEGNRYPKLSDHGRSRQLWGAIQHSPLAFGSVARKSAVRASASWYSGQQNSGDPIFALDVEWVHLGRNPSMRFPAEVCALGSSETVYETFCCPGDARLGLHWHFLDP